MEQKKNLFGSPSAPHHRTNPSQWVFRCYRFVAGAHRHRLFNSKSFPSLQQPRPFAFNFNVENGVSNECCVRCRRCCLLLLLSLLLLTRSHSHSLALRSHLKWRNKRDFQWWQRAVHKQNITILTLVRVCGGNGNGGCVMRMCKRCFAEGQSKHKSQTHTWSEDLRQQPYGSTSSKWAAQQWNERNEYFGGYFKPDAKL